MSDGGAKHQKSGKASFDEIYNAEDPRAYFNELGRLDYRTPEHGRRVFSAVLEGMPDVERPAGVLDVCCSYGVNAALLKYRVTLDDLYARYASAEVLGLSGEELLRSDRDFYSRRARREEHPAPNVVGLDISENAVSYAVKAGLIEDGFAENLEDEEASEGLLEAVAGTDLLTVTGGIGYISERTFDRLLGESEKTPWVAAFALRWVSYEAISDVLSRHGLVTEKLKSATFDQRRFADPEERDYVLEELSRLGLDPEGKESEGSYHAEFYLSRPAERAEETPLESLLAPALDRGNETGP